MESAQYEKYKKDVFEERSTSIDETIEKNSLPIFSTSQWKKRSQAKRIKAIRHDVSLFGRLYISNQHQDGDPDAFFSHENQPHPPSLADLGELRLGTKSDLLKWLEDTKVNTQPQQVRECKVFYGGALIHMFTKSAHIFSDYATMVFLPFLKLQLEKFQRVDVVWDRYLETVSRTLQEQRGVVDRDEPITEIADSIIRWLIIPKIG